MKSRETSWSAINEEAEATEVVNNRPAGELVVDMLMVMVSNNFRLTTLHNNSGKQVTSPARKQNKSRR